MAEAEAQNLVSPEEARAAEVEQLRKRGWMPPGLQRRQKSLRDRLRASEGRNPFLGGSRVYSRRGKSSSQSNGGEDPFADQEATEITPQEVDEFFEIDRTSSILELNNRPVCRPFYEHPVCGLTREILGDPRQRKDNMAAQGREEQEKQSETEG